MQALINGGSFIKKLHFSASNTLWPSNMIHGQSRNELLPSAIETNIIIFLLWDGHVKLWFTLLTVTNEWLIVNNFRNLENYRNMILICHWITNLSFILLAPLMSNSSAIFSSSLFEPPTECPVKLESMDNLFLSVTTVNHSHYKRVSELEVFIFWNISDRLSAKKIVQSNFSLSQKADRTLIFNFSKFRARKEGCKHDLEIFCSFSVLNCFWFCIHFHCLTIWVER